MSEILTIRFNSDPKAMIPWLVWSPNQQNVIASGEANSVVQLAKYAKDREVMVLADSASLMLISVVLPSGSERQLETILPYLLEDNLAQDVDQVHVALLGKTETLAHVAVIDRCIMQRWLDLLSDAGISIKRLIPDCLCLPHRDDAYSAVSLSKRWLLRFGEMQGGAAEDRWLLIWLRGVNSECNYKHVDFPVVSYSTLPVSAPMSWRCEPTEQVLLLLAQGAMQHRYTLLTGKYKPQSQMYKHLKLWRGVAIVASVLLCVQVAEEVTNLYQMETQARQYREESEARLRTVLPNNQHIPTASYFRLLMNNEVSRLSEENQQTGVMVWLAELGPLLKSVSGIELDSMRYDQKRGEFRFNARGKEFGDFEKLREVLSSKYETERGQLSRNQQSVTGAFVLKRS
ncbi:type II secretion system protein GspL [Candidatus Enterovibrio escicola]|uniref:type II secretion system protein GspL n=2 Tax=Candidatus Enterovibrio escicola TaxID=1927127 RepID=UPI001237F777|nr:type II secretion system protein GspL [Candidatus Enterovibrio escacola]